MPAESTAPERNKHGQSSVLSPKVPLAAANDLQRPTGRNESIPLLGSSEGGYPLVLNSLELMRSGRLRELLLYMIRAVESNASDRLTERCIGIEVFGRERDWDPSIDPCVRVAVGRLRTKLATYYEHSGRNDSSKVVLIKGSYVPQILHTEISLSETGRVSSDSVQEERSLRAKQLTPSIGRIVFSLFIISLAIVLLATIRWKSRAAADRNADRFEMTPFSTEAGTQFSPAISPDEKTIAYVWDKSQAQFHVFVRPVAGGSELEIPGGNGNDFYPSWSPDGSQLAFLRVDGREGKLVVANLATGDQKVVGAVGLSAGRWAEDSGPLLGDPGPTWSADGNDLIAFDQEHFGVYAISLLTGQRRQLTYDSDGTRDFYPRISPDGQWLAFVRYITHGVGDLYVLPLRSGGEPRQLTHDRRTIRGISWSGDSQTLTIASNRSGSFELCTVNIKSSAIAALPSDTAYAADPVLASKGDWLAFDNLHEVISIYQAIVPKVSMVVSMHPLITSLGRNRWASRSPDGMKIAFTSDRSGTWQIWLAGPDGRAPKQVSQLDGSLTGGINWAPDSKHGVFDGRASGHSAIYLMDIATGVSTRLLPDSLSEDVLPYWSPDGQEIYFSSNKDGSVALYRMAVNSRQVTLVARDGFRAIPTQDGHWIYYSTRSNVLWRVPAEGGTPTELPPSLQTYSSSTWTVVGNNLLILKRDVDDPTILRLLDVDPQLRVHSTGVITLAPQTAVISVQNSATEGEIFLDVQTQMTSEIVLRRREEGR
jgi:Tol biopolymer transport system component